jgi:hypothetical protein
MVNDFLDNLSIQKDTYRQIYLNHYEFYEKHKEMYIETLRDDLLNMHYSYKIIEDALALANETINREKHEKEQIKQSTFWRITKPARFIVDMLRKRFI